MLIAFLIFAATAKPAGLLPFSPTRERLLVGKAPFGDAKRAAVSPRSYGSFEQTPDGLTLVEAAPHGDSVYWFEGETFANGLVRARVKGGAEIIVRAAFAETGDVVAGYTLILGKTTARLDRYGKGTRRALMEDQKGLFAAGTELEVVILALGPWLSVQILDGKTLKPLASFAIADDTLASGLIAVRLSKEAKLSLLTVGSHLETKGEIKAGVRAIYYAEAKTVADASERELLRRAGTTFKESDDIPFELFDTQHAYRDADAIEAKLKRLAQDHPDVATLHALGTSHEGRTVWGLLLTRDPNAPAVLLDGAHHGGELLASEMALDAIDQLLTGEDKRYLDSLAIWCVPLVNVDGNMHYLHTSREHARKNARDNDNDGTVDSFDGVDLYRNYPTRFGALGEEGSRSYPPHWRYRGPSPASEPEVKALVALAERERFVASLDFHTPAMAVIVPYTDPGMRSPEINEAQTLAERMAAALKQGKTTYRVLRNLYPVDGTAQDFFRFRYGTLALLLEGPLHNPLPYAEKALPAIVSTRPGYRTLLERVASGPVLSLKVQTSGKPVEASVVIDELPTRFGEVWTSRPRDGRYERLVDASGTYTVRIAAAGYKTQTQRVAVQPKRGAQTIVNLERE